MISFVSEEVAKNWGIDEIPVFVVPTNGHKKGIWMVQTKRTKKLVECPWVKYLFERYRIVFDS